MAAKKQIITGLDVGTSKVVTIVGTKTNTDTVDIIGIGETPCSGLRKGMVIDIEETISAISASLEKAERMSGIPIENAIVGIGGDHITSTNSKGVIAVSRADGEISQEDIERVIEAARAVSMPANREILHVIPRIFTVDGQEGIKDPVGMNGIRLEVEAHVIGGSTPVIKNLSKCVYQTGVDIDDLVFSALATSNIILNKKQKEVGVVIADIGAGTTDIAVFEEGDILHSAVLPIGSSHITYDIAIGLRTSPDVAEELKIKYGCANPEEVEDEEIDISKIDSTEDQKISSQFIAQIIEARLNEMFSLIKDELKSINRDGTLPAGIILTGGGSKMKNIIDIAKDTLHLPARISEPQIEISGLIDKVGDPAYTLGMGLMVWGAQTEKQKHPTTFDFGGVKSASSKIKNWFKQFLP